MDPLVVLRRLVEMAGGATVPGYVLALTNEALRDAPAELPTAAGRYAVVHPTSEIGLRHVLWQASGAPVLALLPEPLARKLPADLVRRARGHRVHAVEASELLSLALGVPVVNTLDDELQQLALDHLEKLRDALGERTLPTVIDRELLEEILLDVVLGRQVRKSQAGELLGAWLRDPPTFPAAAFKLVRRQLPRMHGLEGKVLAWGAGPVTASTEANSLDLLLVHGVLIALDEAEIPQSAWGPLWEAPGLLGLTRETFRTALTGLVRQTLDALGPAATPFLKRAESLANRLLTPAVLARSRDLPLGLDNRCVEIARAMASGAAVGHGDIQDIQRHRFATERTAEIAVLEQMARLTRYLAQPAPDSGVSSVPTVPHRVRQYQQDGAFADWTAQRLGAARAKSAAYGKEANLVLERYRARRDEENRGFAEALASDYVGAVYGEGCVPLHRIWRHAPVQRVGQEMRGEGGREVDPLFLVVLDGCSYPVFIGLVAELASDVAPLGLRVDANTQRADGVPALSLLPTITSHARSAIFLGETPKDPWIAETVWRDTKEAATDPARFKQNTALGARTRRLFLKGDLADHGEALLGALRDPALEVVAVVFNAVDDQIGSSNTGAAVTVRAETISGLIPSLRVALKANRRVIVTADHGHTPFCGKNLRVGEGTSARFRLLGPTEIAPNGFIEIASGDLGGGPERKAFAWKMGAYQGQPQVGFHGGCSLEEMVVPLAELVEGGVAANEPPWWYAGAAMPARAHTAPARAEPPRAAPVPTKPVQGDLFDRSALHVAALDRIGLPSPLRAALDVSEQGALACVFTNQSARISDIAAALARPPQRVRGLLPRLVQKLHDGGFPCLRRQALVDGDEQYVYVPQGTERAAYLDGAEGGPRER